MLKVTKVEQLKAEVERLTRERDEAEARGAVATGRVSTNGARQASLRPVSQGEGMNTEPYTLSDAIRIGAAIRPQAFHALFVDGRSCAMGAAIEGLTGAFCDGGDRDAARLDELEDVLHRRYRPILRQRVTCPECPPQGREFLSDLIVHLNDVHKWTREQTANFVQSVEERIGYVTISVEAETDQVVVCGGC